MFRGVFGATRNALDRSYYSHQKMTSHKFVEIPFIGLSPLEEILGAKLPKNDIIFFITIKSSTKKARLGDPSRAVSGCIFVCIMRRLISKYEDDVYEI